MDDEIRVDFGSLQQAHGDMMLCTQKIEQRLKRLEDDLKPLVTGGIWTGQAAELYKFTQRQINAAISDMHFTLGHLGGAVRDSHDTFHQTEQRNAAMF